MSESNPVTIALEGGPRNGEEVTLAKGHIPRVMDVLGIAEGVESGSYELRYVWQGESEEPWYCRGCLSGKDGRDCDTTCGCACHGAAPVDDEVRGAAQFLVSLVGNKLAGPFVQVDASALDALRTALAGQEDADV